MPEDEVAKMLSAVIGEHVRPFLAHVQAAQQAAVADTARTAELVTPIDVDAFVDEFRARYGNFLANVVGESRRWLRRRVEEFVARRVDPERGLLAAVARRDSSAVPVPRPADDVPHVVDALALVLVGDPVPLDASSLTPTIHMRALAA